MECYRAMVSAVLLLTVAAVPAGQAAAWEVRLRASVVTHSPLVRLADVADVAGDDVPAGVEPDQIVVALGPTARRSRELTASDVRRKLDQQGVDLSGCRMAGAPRVVVTYGSQRTANETGLGTVAPNRERALPHPRPATSLQEQLKELVAQQLAARDPEGCPWSVDVSFADHPPADLSVATDRVTVEPAPEATEGLHRLVACVTTDAAVVRVSFEARASRLVPAVIPVRAVARGELIGADDVRLDYVDKATAAGTLVQRLEDAVGRQARQNLTSEQPLSVRVLQQPLLVRKRDEVDVWVRCGGIRAHRRAVALADGTRGDLIAVETKDESKTQFNARVVDIRQVEVLPNSTSVTQ